jgi:hypothetical protein
VWQVQDGVEVVDPVHAYSEYRSNGERGERPRCLYGTRAGG